MLRESIKFKNLQAALFKAERSYSFVCEGVSVQYCVIIALHKTVLQSLKTKFYVQRDIEVNQKGTD